MATMKDRPEKGVATAAQQRRRGDLLRGEEGNERERRRHEQNG
jgi:hypothetical protein